MKCSLNYSLLCFLIALVGAQHISDTPCPERPIQQNFDIVKVINIISLHTCQADKKIVFHSTHLAVLGMTFYDTRRGSRRAANVALPITIWTTIIPLKLGTAVSASPTRPWAAPSAKRFSANQITFHWKRNWMSASAGVVRFYWFIIHACYLV